MSCWLLVWWLWLVCVCGEGIKTNKIRTKEFFLRTRKKVRIFFLFCISNHSFLFLTCYRESLFEEREERKMDDCLFCYFWLLWFFGLFVCDFLLSLLIWFDFFKMIVFGIWIWFELELWIVNRNLQKQTIGLMDLFDIDDSDWCNLMLFDYYFWKRLHFQSTICFEFLINISHKCKHNHFLFVWLNTFIFIR